MLPKKVKLEVDVLFTNSTLISSSLPLVETVEDDDEINHKGTQIDRDNVVHMFDNNNDNNNNHDDTHCPCS